MTARAPEDDAAAQDRAAPGLDSRVPSPARIWNYWVGGKDHFAVDREAAAKIQEGMPGLPMPVVAKTSRAFLAEAVNRLVADYGIRQFLDIGTGLPAADNTHEVAQRAAPESRIVYADYDPSVLAHARALLVGTREGTTDYIQADLRDTTVILTEAARTLDFSKPVAILLIAVLHFIPDSDDPYGIVRCLLDALMPGSFLVVVHAPKDINSDQIAEMARRYNDSGAERMHPRTRQDILRFFDGLEMIGPGLAPLGAWLPAAPADAVDERARGSAVGAIGRKPPTAHPSGTLGPLSRG